MELNLPMANIAIITQCFLRHASALLVEHGCLSLQDFGVLLITTHPASPPIHQVRHFVTFKKAPALAKAVRVRSKEVPYGEVFSRRDGDIGAGEAGGTGVPSVRSQT